MTIKIGCGWASCFCRCDEVVTERVGESMKQDERAEAARRRIWQKIEEIREQNRGVDPDEVEREVNAVVEAIREEKRAAARAARITERQPNS